MTLAGNILFFQKKMTGNRLQQAVFRIRGGICRNRGFTL